MSITALAVHAALNIKLQMTHSKAAQHACSEGVSRLARAWTACKDVAVPHV